MTHALNLMMEAGFSESPKILEIIVFRLSIHRQCQMWPEVLEDSIKAKEILNKTDASDILNFMVTAQLGYYYYYYFFCLKSLELEFIIRVYLAILSKKFTFSSYLRSKIFIYFLHP